MSKTVVAYLIGKLDTLFAKSKRKLPFDFLDFSLICSFKYFSR